MATVLDTNMFSFVKAARKNRKREKFVKVPAQVADAYIEDTMGTYNSYNIRIADLEADLKRLEREKSALQSKLDEMTV